MLPGATPCNSDSSMSLARCRKQMSSFTKNDDDRVASRLMATVTSSESVRCSDSRQWRPFCSTKACTWA
ncbi:hypothetical protein D3C75_1044340 [compost metagenome]